MYVDSEDKAGALSHKLSLLGTHLTAEIHFIMLSIYLHCIPRWWNPRLRPPSSTVFILLFWQIKHSVEVNEKDQESEKKMKYTVCQEMAATYPC